MTVYQESAPVVSHLLDDYRPGTFCFAAPTGTLLTRGEIASVPQARPGGPTTASRAAAVLAAARGTGHVDPLVVGAMPFDPSAPHRLLVPAMTGRAGPVAGGGTAPQAASRTAPQAAPRRPTRMTPVPRPEAYTDAVARAVGMLRAGRLDKVVLARSLDLGPGADIDVPAMLQALARRDPTGYTFAVDLTDGPLPSTGGPARRSLVGASPELLVAKTGPHVVSHPLAGSAPRSADPAEDTRRGHALTRSAKDRHEHAVVVEAVADVLAPYCRVLHVPEAPTVVGTAAMWHLGSRITGKLKDPALPVLELAEALHPTPAVCGTPTPDARALIAELEAFDRGYYTGMVGWCDEAGDGEWIVTIRCADIDPGALRLFAGAGIVADSDPEAELAETTAKFRTLLDALRLDPTDAGVTPDTFPGVPA